MAVGEDWQGDGWHVVNLGRISEVKLSSQDQHFTYICIFPDESSGERYTEKIAAYMNQDFQGEKSELMKKEFETFLKSLNYRTKLDKSDLEAIQTGAIRFPEFYREAVKDDITRIILF